MIVIMELDYYLNSPTTLCRRIWMSFFDTEELHAGMLDSVSDHRPVMPIFSRRYLFASRDVVTEEGSNESAGDSEGFQGVNPTSVTTARSGGILFEISPLENSHDLLWEINGASCLWINQSLKTGIQQGEM